MTHSLTASILTPFLILLLVIAPALAAYAYHRAILKTLPAVQPIPRCHAKRLWDWGMAIYLLLAVLGFVALESRALFPTPRYIDEDGFDINTNRE